MWRPPDTHFEIKKAVSWPEPAYRRDEEKKRLFGMELAKSPDKPFEAGCRVFGADTNAALWASINWLNDPIVLASKQAYANTVEQTEKLLDKEALARKLLTIAEEKDPSGRFYVLEGKDRIATLKLYAEVQGFIGNKALIDASTNNTFNNELKLILVKSDKKEEEKPIKIVNNDFENLNTSLPPNIKLVASSR